jgi:hypothetical protein
MLQARTNSSVQTFPIKPPPRSTMICLWVILTFMAVVMVCFMQMVGGMGWLFGSIFLPIMLVLTIVVLSTRNTRFKISHNGLDITGGWVGQSLSWNELDTSNARMVKFSAEPSLKPKWKTVGLAMPGCCAGWFRLYDKSKALVFLTDEDEAIYLPTRKDFSVLLSAKDNSALLQALQQGGKPWTGS